jgi:hypothetical protein
VLDDGQCQRAVVLASLFCKAEEAEENERGDDRIPAVELEAANHSGVKVPHNRWILTDKAKVDVCICPTFPRHQRYHSEVVRERVASQGQGEKNVSARHGHESEVTID